MDDIRIKFSLNKNIKTRRLIQSCGYEGYFCLINLWVYVAQNAPKGKLKGYKKSDLEIIAEWTGKSEHFATELINIGFVLENSDGIIIHDWKDHQGFVYKSEDRRIQARNAGLKSGERRVKPKATNSSTDSSTESQLTVEPPSLPIPSSPSPSLPKKVNKKLVDKSTPAKPNPNIKVLSDGYFKLYDKHVGGKPAWGAQETKRSKELLARYDDNAKGILATIKYMFETEDDCWTKNVGTYVSMTSTRLMDRAIAHRRKPHKKENPL